MSAATSSEPPVYVAPGENPIPSEHAEIPDDFKYSEFVAECDIEIRHRFLQRVYLLLAGQIALTVIISAGLIMHPTWLNWTLNHQWSMIASVLTSLVCMVGAMILRRRYPWNLVFLTLFTAAEGWLIGVVTSLFDTKLVVNVFVITAVVFVSLSIFAMQTKYDFTGWQPYLTVALCGMLGVGFIAMFTNSPGLTLLYSYVMVVFFSVSIVVDTQMIMERFHPEDEIAATIELYLDAVNLFLNLLRVLSDGDA